MVRCLHQQQITNREIKMSKVQIPSHVMLTVIRPNGVTETVRHPTFTEISEKTFKAAQAATAKAGRGQLISYENVKKEAKYTMTAADLATQSTEKIEKMMAFGEKY